MVATKPLRIKFDEVDGLIRVYDETRYLALFSPEKYDVIYNRVRYLTSQKIGIIYVIIYNYARIKIDSYEKTLPLHNVIILIKSVFNKNKNHYYYDIFLRKISYQLLENIDNK